MASSAGFACIVFVIVLCSLTGYDACSLDPNVTQSCLDEVIKLQTSVPTAETDVAAYCQNVTNLCPYVTDDNCTCATNGTGEHLACLKFTGYKSALQFFCENSVERAVFLTYRPCIVPNNQPLIDSCRVNATTCPELNTAFECYFRGMRTKCTELAVTVVMTQSLLRRAKPQLVNINCAIDTSKYNYDKTGVSSAVGLSLEFAAALTPALITVMLVVVSG